MQQFNIQFSEPRLSSNYIVDQPQFKFCKKRKEFFSNEYDQIWYKSPYKYNMRMKVTSTVPCMSSELVTQLSVTHEDGSVVKCKGDLISYTPPVTPKKKSNNSRKSTASVTPSEISSSDSDSDEEASQQSNKPLVPNCHHEVKLGPFQFNVCSYKYDGKKFRLTIHLYTKSDNKLICSLTSPAFLIKAKKPIAKPGIKSLKRNHEEMSQSQSNNTTGNGNQTAVVETPAPVSTSPIDSSLVSSPNEFAHNPFLSSPHITPENFEMQKKLIESQLFQFGCVLNNLVNNVRSGLPSSSPHHTPYLQSHEEPFAKKMRMSPQEVYSTEAVMNPTVLPMVPNPFMPPSLMSPQELLNTLPTMNYEYYYPSLVPQEDADQGCSNFLDEEAIYDACSNNLPYDLEDFKPCIQQFPQFSNAYGEAPIIPHVKSEVADFDFDTFSAQPEVFLL